MPNRNGERQGILPVDVAEKVFAAGQIETSDLDDLLGEIDEASAGQELPKPVLTSLDFRGFLRGQYAGYRHEQLSRLYPDVRQRFVEVYTNEFLGRIKGILATDALSLEIVPTPSTEEEQGDPEQEIRAILEKIISEKIQPLAARLEWLDEESEDGRYISVLELSQAATTVRGMFEGLTACTDRNLFDNFTDPSVGRLFFDVKGQMSAVHRKVQEKRKEVAKGAISPHEWRAEIKKPAFTAEAVAEMDDKIDAKIAERIAKEAPENPNQHFLAAQMRKDIIEQLRATGDLDKEEQRTLLLLDLPGRFDGWLDYKALLKTNPDYVGGGVANIALADDFIRYGGEHPFAVAEEFLKQRSSKNEQGPARGADFFLSEISAIYESRRSIEAILASVEGRNELLTPAEAMREISDLTGAMNSKDLERVLEIVERLESKTIDLYHSPPDSSSFESILADGKLYSAWANRRYGDTFFGGGLYFWGSQQEDWLKGGQEAIHAVYPMKDIFAIRNKYNNPNKGPFSRESYYGNAGQFPHAQKKFNIICMIPALALNIERHTRAAGGPLSNEGYTAQEIADVEQYGLEESNFIWRIDKHYGNYDSEYFIDEKKEAQLREALGDEIRVERGVTTPGFAGGEYDRLIIPRSVSILKATSIAYSLRLSEVVYEDRVEALRKETSDTQETIMSAYKEDIETKKNEHDPEMVKMVLEYTRAQGMDERDSVLAEAVLLDMPDELLARLHKAVEQVHEHVGAELPTKKHVEQFIPRREWFIRESKIHGTPHLMRVLMNAELLGRLARVEMPGADINIRALEIAACMHDVRRLNDRASDVWHGKRASEYLQEHTDVFPEADQECRLCACGVMHNHSLDDHDQMTAEEIVFKDSDALDRYRFSAGPDWRHMRLESSKVIAPISDTMAVLSSFYIDNGYKRAEAVLKAAEVLKLFGQETDEKEAK